jgi:RNA recognition motif-containing protein
MEKETQLYVGGLSYNTVAADVKAAFTPLGAVKGFQLIFDRDTQLSKGFGFLTFEVRDCVGLCA